MSGYDYAWMQEGAYLHGQHAYTLPYLLSKKNDTTKSKAIRCQDQQEEKGHIESTMTPQELIQITGQHLLFMGIGTYSWTLDQFRQAAQFAKAHGVDCLLVKVADGGNIWQSMDGWHNIYATILNEGVGVIPYAYSYGDKFGAFGTEMEIMLAFLKDCGVFCADLEAEWNGRTDLARQLCSKLQGQAGCFMVSTWADPSLQNWTGVIAVLAPCTTVFMPQVYNNYLATFWPEFGQNGAQWLQPTVDLTQDFGANDPAGIAKAAHDEGHTAISVWYYDTAVANPALLDQIYAAFPKQQGGTTVQQYSPNSSDFNAYFTVDANGNWQCKQTSAVIIGGNKGLFSQLSIDGNTLPVIGLPRTNELYQQDSDGYNWSVQFFERGVVVYDPEHKKDGQPGFGASYIGKPEQFIELDPNYQQQTAIPAELRTGIATIADNVAAVQKVADRFP